MINSKYRANINDVKPVMINHGTGVKKVFASNEDTDTSLTQIAWSKFEHGDKCDLHFHPTMDEYFFVLKGNGMYEIGAEVLALEPGDFIRIPPNTPHKLKVEKQHEILELIYFGITTD